MRNSFLSKFSPRLMTTGLLTLLLSAALISLCGTETHAGGKKKRIYFHTVPATAAPAATAPVQPTIVPTAAAVSESQVTLTQSDSKIDVAIDGKPFTTLHYAKDQRKPFFHPVYGADGTPISRPLENPKDHPHHKGLWFSVDEVNKSRHWMERSPIETAEVKILKGEGNPAQLQITSHWKADDGKHLLTETTTVSIFANRLIIYDATLKAATEPVEFEDTKEGMFAFRFRDELREVSGASVSNADGLKTSKECWGQESDWVDYHGTLDGKTYGVALFDHPLNFRRSRYHVRDYGLFSINPFGPHAYTNGALPKDPTHLPTGSFVRLRYGAYIHDGNTDEGKVKETYQQFLKNS